MTATEEATGPPAVEEAEGEVAAAAAAQAEMNKAEDESAPAPEAEAAAADAGGENAPAAAEPEEAAATAVPVVEEEAPAPPEESPAEAAAPDEQEAEQQGAEAPAVEGDHEAPGQTSAEEGANEGEAAEEAAAAAAEPAAPALAEGAPTAAATAAASTGDQVADEEPARDLYDPLHKRFDSQEMRKFSEIGIGDGILEPEEGEQFDELDYDLQDVDTYAREGLGSLLDEVRGPGVQKEYNFNFEFEDEEPEREFYESSGESSTDESELEAGLQRLMGGDGGPVQEHVEEEDPFTQLVKAGGKIPRDRIWELLSHYFEVAGLGDPRDELERLQMSMDSTMNQSVNFLTKNCQSLADQVEAIASNWFDAPYESAEDIKNMGRIRAAGGDVEKYKRMMAKRKKEEKKTAAADKYLGAPHLAKQHEVQTGRITAIVNGQKKHTERVVSKNFAEADERMWTLAEALCDLLVQVKRKGADGRAKAREVLGGGESFLSPMRKNLQLQLEMDPMQLHPGATFYYRASPSSSRGLGSPKNAHLLKKKELLDRVADQAAAATSPESSAPPSPKRRLSPEDIIFLSLRQRVIPRSEREIVINVRLEPPEKGTVRPAPDEPLWLPKSPAKSPEKSASGTASVAQSPAGKPLSLQSLGKTASTVKFMTGGKPFAFGASPTAPATGVQVATGTAANGAANTADVAPPAPRPGSPKGILASPSAKSPKHQNSSTGSPSNRGTPSGHHHHHHGNQQHQEAVGASYLRALRRIADEATNPPPKTKFRQQRTRNNNGDLGLSAAQQLTVLDRFHRGEKQFVKLKDAHFYPRNDHTEKKPTIAAMLAGQTSTYNSATQQQFSATGRSSSQFLHTASTTVADGRSMLTATSADNFTNSLMSTTAIWNNQQRSVDGTNTDAAAQNNSLHQQSQSSFRSTTLSSSILQPQMNNSMSMTNFSFYDESMLSENDRGLFDDLEEQEEDSDEENEVAAQLEKRVIEKRKRRNLVRKPNYFTKQSRCFENMRSARSATLSYPIFSEPVLFVPEPLRDNVQLKDAQIRRRLRKYQTDGAAFGLTKFMKPREKDKKSVKGIMFGLRVSSLVNVAAAKFKAKGLLDNTYKTGQGVSQYLDKVAQERMKLEKEKQGKQEKQGKPSKADVFKKETKMAQSRRELLSIFDNFRRHSRRLNYEMSLLTPDYLFDNVFLYSNFSFPMLRRKAIKQFEREMKLRVYMRKPSELLLIQKKLSSGFRRMKEDQLSIDHRRMLRDIGRMGDYKEYRQRKPRNELPLDPEELAMYEQQFEDAPLIDAHPKMPDEKVFFVKSRAQAPDPSADKNSGQLGKRPERMKDKEPKIRYIWRDKPDVPLVVPRIAKAEIEEKQAKQAIDYAKVKPEAKKVLRILHEDMVPTYYKKEKEAEKAIIKSLSYRVMRSKSGYDDAFLSDLDEEEEEEEDEVFDEEEQMRLAAEAEQKAKMIEKYGADVAEKLLKAQEIEVVEFLPPIDPREETDVFYSKLTAHARKMEEDGEVSKSNWKYRLSASQMMRKKAKLVSALNKAMSTDDGEEAYEDEETAAAKDALLPGDLAGKELKAEDRKAAKEQQKAAGGRGGRMKVPKFVREGFYRFLAKEMGVASYRIPRDNSAKMVKLMWNVYEESYARTLWQQGVEKFGPKIIATAVSNPAEAEHFKKIMMKYGLAQGKKLRVAMSSAGVFQDVASPAVKAKQEEALKNATEDDDTEHKGADLSFRMDLLKGARKATNEIAEAQAEQTAAAEAADEAGDGAEEQ
ncbi:unnamed protein product [Amoebophrya sp. A120]|nr:unnamed protein product [Amoebophrya sp. A120]|eukprot:GSA120T00022618001.1